MNKQSGYRTNFIGGGEEVVAVTVDMDKEAIDKTNSVFWNTAGNEVLGSAALPLYGAFISEDKCKLFGDVTGQTILEIGCGSGHSLQYLGGTSSG